MNITAIRLLFVRTNAGFVVTCKIPSVVAFWNAHFYYTFLDRDSLPLILIMYIHPSIHIHAYVHTYVSTCISFKYRSLGKLTVGYFCVKIVHGKIFLSLGYWLKLFNNELFFEVELFVLLLMKFMHNYT